MSTTTVIKSDVANPALASEGKKKIEWAARNMPVLAQIKDRFAKEKPFTGFRIAACMHVTTETANLMLALKAGGADIALCASNPLSTQDDTAAALVYEYGISVFAKNAVDRDGYYKHLNSALDIKPQLVFDDGCDLVNVLHTSRTELIEGVMAGCEETTTGVIRLSQMAKDGALKFPMIAVNDTDTKHMFDNRYGTGQSTFDAIFRATNTLVAGKIVVVAGFGYCGKGVAERAKGLGAEVIVTEIDPTKALDALMQGFRVMPMTKAAAIGDLFITVTGNRDVLRDEHFRQMKDGAILANSGHFDIEIDVAWLEKNAKVKNSKMRHQTDEYVMADGRRILLIAEGRLANLGAAEGRAPSPHRASGEKLATAVPRASVDVHASHSHETTEAAENGVQRHMGAADAGVWSECTSSRSSSGSVVIVVVRLGSARWRRESPPPPPMHGSIVTRSLMCQTLGCVFFYLLQRG